MPEPPPKKSKHYQDIEDVPLSPDIEWMIQSRQVGHDVIVEALVGGYYRDLYQISLSILKDTNQARECVFRTLLLAVRNSHRYWGKQGVKVWLFNLCVDQCIKFKQGFRVYQWFSRNNVTSLNSLPVLENTLHEEIWHILDDLNLKDRLVLIFHYGFELTAPEIAAVLRSRANTIRSIFHEANRKFMLKLQKLPGNPTLGDDDIKEALQGRFNQTQLSQDENTQTIVRILEKINQRESTSKRKSLVQQFLLVVLVIGLVVTISWMTNVFAAEPTRKAVVQTVIVTQVVYVPPKQPESMSDTPHQLPEMLSLDSTVDDILLRMRDSQYLWHTLWLDGRVIDYGPPGYTGPPQRRREQVWVSQPSNSLVLTGWVGGEVNHIWYASDSKVYDVDIQTERPVLYDYHPGILPVYSFFEDQIFPRRAEVEAKYVVSGREQVAGRNSIIIDGYDGRGERVERLWVDAITGIVLRKLEYATDGESVIFEVVVRKILFDPSFPQNFFNRNNLVKNFSNDQYGEPFPISEEYPIPIRTPAPGHAAIPQVTSPEGFDPSKSDIQFQWSQPSTHDAALYASLMPVNLAENYGEVSPVNIFADNYFLGQVNFNPWHAYCERTSDGDTVAISSVYNDKDKVEYSLQVIDLSDFGDIQDLTPEIKPLDITIAMNPKSRQLAFFGCNPDESVLSCGVYLADLNTGNTSLIYPTDNISRMFWSPDGEFLAVVMLPSTQRHDAVVIDVETSSLAFTGNYDYQVGQFPIDSPAHGWDSKITESGLAACLSP